MHFLFLPCLPLSRFRVDPHATDLVTVLEAIGNLSNDVFERRTSTGSEAFSLLKCLDANKFVLLSYFRKTAVLKKYELVSK